MQVRATQRGFYGSLREVGDEFELFEPETDYAESWMTPVDGEAPKAAAQAEEPAEAEAPRYTINHVGGGNYEVLDNAVPVGSDGIRVGDLYRLKDGEAKERAQAEADRLNAGGEPPLADEPPPEQSEPETSDGLPDA